MIEIRSAAHNDALWLHTAEQEIFSDSWSRESIQSHLASNFGSGLILTLDGERIGYLLASRIGDEAELLRIGILKQNRNCGFGNALLSYWLETQKDLGTLHFFLEVRKENRSAASLYEKNGFLAVGVREGYYSNPADDAVLYQIHLKEA